MQVTKETLDHVFTYHAPTEDQIERYRRIRAAGRHLAAALLADCPDSRERSLALTSVQQAVQWGNTSIATNGGE